MSKIKKTKVVRKEKISELDIKLEKIIKFSGWIFLLVLGALMGAWVIMDDILGLIELNLNAMTFSFIIFTGTNSAISFGLTSKIKNSRNKKKEYFHDWLIGEFLFCMFAIFTVAAYQW
ncbi:MAG: hypothetical protein ACXABO_15840 [Promethearchaeota archaeon]|jgi:hypothetical protein